jgi:hypothetical protein
VTIPIKRCLVILTICQALAAQGHIAAAQQAEAQTDHAARIKALSEQLRWHDEAGREQYEAARDNLTQSVLQEIDSYVAESFNPGSTSADQVRDGIDALWGRKKGDMLHDLAFLTDLPGGHFLIVGIELWRGGPAIAEDKMSFRAYKASGNNFAYVSSIDALAGTPDAVKSQALLDLNAEALKSPVHGEFWFIAWADVPPLSPPQIAMRLYAFDGKNFRTVWEPPVIISGGIDDAVQLTPNGRGFIVNQMPDWQSQIILHKRYSLAANGPQEVSESTSERK